MIVHDVEQGSAAWFKVRRGIPTASEFDQIITPVKGELSRSWKAYAARLIWEKIMNTTTQSLENIEHVQNGKLLEPQAVRHFEFVRDIKTTKVGFVTTDDGLVGASPDRLIGDPWNATLEVKCPTGPVHMYYSLFGPKDSYRPQIQGQLMVCEVEQGYFLSYIENGPDVTIHTFRDDAYCKAMASALEEFNSNLFRLTEKAHSLGIFQAYAEADAPIDAAYGEVAADEKAAFISHLEDF